MRKKMASWTQFFTQVFKSLVITSFFTSKHVHATPNIGFFLFFLLLFFLFLGSISTSAATAASSSATAGRGQSNQFSNLFGRTQKVGKNNWVEGFDFSISSSL